MENILQIPSDIPSSGRHHHHSHQSTPTRSRHMNHTIDLEPLRDFSLDHLHKLMSGEPTVPKYMEFYHALHDHVISKGYKSLGDGCMGNRKGFTPEEEIEYSEAVKSEFDVKVLLIARDPVRRAFSHYRYMLAYYKRKGITTPRQMRFPNYTDDLHTIRKYYNNVYVTVMEELWEGDGARELSQFLDHPIRNLWKNLYAPDRSHLIEYDEDVPCQSQGQNLAELTPEIYDYYRKKYDWIYQSWKREFGSLPLYWGKPL